MPRFAAHDDAPLVYVSFGSLGAGDTELLKRIVAAFAGKPYRVLVNVGDYLDSYDAPPDNVHLAGWYPQPSGDPVSRRGHSPWREQQLHGVPLFRKAGADHALRLGRPRQRHTRRRNRARLRAASLRLD